MSDKELPPCPFCGSINTSEHKDDCYLEAIVDYYHRGGETEFTEEEFTAMYNTRTTPPGFKLVPTLAPVSVQRALESGIDQAVTLQEWWEIILKSAPGPENAAKLYENMTSEQRERHLNEVFDVAPELAFESAKIEVLDGDDVVYSEAVPGNAAP